MEFSGPSLHPPVLTSQAHKDLFRATALRMAEDQFRTQALQGRSPPTATSLRFPMKTVSLSGNFDAFINVGLRGSNGAPSVALWVDSGNNSLVLPDYAELQQLPGFTDNYKPVDGEPKEPFGCPAVRLRGPITLSTENNGLFEIEDCVFFACTGPNPKDGSYTANFGVGCLKPRKLGTDDPITPLSVIPEYPYAEFDYAPSRQINVPGTGPVIIGNSYLNLYKALPDDYKNRMFAILKDQWWMSLRPKSLEINGKRVDWPGKRMARSIAMIDTGGGPVFLNDPDDAVWPKEFATSIGLPNWIAGSYCCQALDADPAISLWDGVNKNASYSYRIQRAALPPLASGETLVLCKRCLYMMEDANGKPNDGLNIGGLSALFNYILIDYAGARVGFKPKSPELA
jgi:hypothetical protein